MSDSLRKGLSKRGSYFFVLDAFIAGVIIVASVAVLFSTITIRQSASQSHLLAEDFASFLSETKIKNYAGEAVFQMVADGTITDVDRTLLQQVVLFYDEGTNQGDGNLTLILEEVSSLNENTDVAYFIDDGGGAQLLYATSEEPDDVSTDAVSIKLSSQRIVTVVDDNNMIIGPYVVEVHLWR